MDIASGVLCTPEQPLPTTDVEVVNFFLANVDGSENHKLSQVYRDPNTTGELTTAILNGNKDAIRKLATARSTVELLPNVGDVKLTVVIGDGLFPIIRTPPLRSDEPTNPHYRQITDSATYWFSSEFYQGGDDGSSLEIATQYVLSGGQCELKDIVEIYEALLPARPLERFYYLSLLVYLLNNIR